ncbi:uncharacterized protein LOC131845930 [Achroia grisella]|uniref:uncharacterized protein LOC131845930 n=1 Tax=Achroia grisella TaxID=688607 RepID=UPI0027D268CE|nr:uncharacterized protein LOC131845930 [Achroia grisella]
MDNLTDHLSIRAASSRTIWTFEPNDQARTSDLTEDFIRLLHIKTSTLSKLNLGQQQRIVGDLDRRDTSLINSENTAHIGTTTRYPILPLSCTCVHYCGKHLLQCLRRSELPVLHNRAVCRQLASASTVSYTKADLQLRIQNAANLFSEFNNLQSKLEELVLEVDLDEQIEQRGQFEDSYFNTLSQAECMLSGENDTSYSKSCPNSNDSLKFPVISVPTFTGLSDQWLQYRDIFLSLVHNNTNISSIQKFHYLKSSLKGTAAMVLDSLEFSANNYSVAWELLLNRFNNSRLLIHNHVKALFTLQTVTKESPDQLRYLIDNILKNLRALKLLGEPVDSWDTLIIYIIVSKLDKISEREWEQYKITVLKLSGNSESRLTVDTLLAFLKDRADMLKFVSENKLCDNCLRPGHRPNECRFGGCRNCNKKHNSLIHKDSEVCNLSPVSERNTAALSMHSSFTEAGERPAAAVIGTDLNINEHSRLSTHTNTLCAQYPCMQPVLLSTALVDVYDKYNNIHTVRALLDSGSERCIMTQSLCDLLNSPIIQSTQEIRGVGNSITQSTKMCDIELKSRISSYTACIRCIVLPHLTSTLPAIPKQCAQFRIPDSVQLADPHFCEPQNIDILIGADKFWDLLSSGRMRLPNGPFLQNTRLGWIISGSVGVNTQNTGQIQCNFTHVTDTQSQQSRELEKVTKSCDNKNRRKLMTSESAKILSLKLRCEIMMEGFAFAFLSSHHHMN